MKKLLVFFIAIIALVVSNNPAVAAPAAKKIVDVHLVYTVGSSLWNTQEITDAYERAKISVDYWNKQEIAVELRIASTSVVAVGMDTVNTEMAAVYANALYSKPGITVFLVRDPWPWVSDGFALKGKWAVVAYTGRMSGTLAHELGHVLGGNDHYYWEYGWKCSTPEIDIMCSISMVTVPNKLTLSEIETLKW